MKRTAPAEWCTCIHVIETDDPEYPPPGWHRVVAGVEVSEKSKE